MSSVLLAELQKLVSAHGYWVVALIVGLESMGLPGVVANDRAECGDRNHHPNVEAGFCRGINGNEYEDRFCQCATVSQQEGVTVSQPEPIAAMSDPSSPARNLLSFSTCSGS